MIDGNKIVELTPTGTIGILKIYFGGEDVWTIFKKGYIYPFLISVIIGLSVFFIEDDFLDFLTNLNSNILDLLPNLLGFTLGAYTLFVGFGGKELLFAITDYKTETSRSLYQKNSAIFAFCIMIQFTTLLLSYIIKVLLELKLEACTQGVADIVNYSIIVVILFLSITSIYVLKDLTVNIFNLSQSYHALLYVEKNKPNKTTSGEEPQKENQ
jgi:hypothetical protein